MKGIIFLIIFIILITNVSAIMINEVETNPPEGSSGIEWVELYNDESIDIDISGWKVWEGLSSPRKIFTIPNETILSSNDFFVIELDNARTLNNAGDFVTLYDSNETKIDETETLKEQKSSSKTWQLCDSWEFLESTKNSENNCSKEKTKTEDTTSYQEDEETKSETSSSDKKSSSEKEIVYEPLAEETPSSIKLETINLNPKVIKTENNNEEISKSYAFYGFVAFSVFLGVLFIIRKNRYKNEFR